jgi:dTDP-glucose 4,6-dehydratase
VWVCDLKHDHSDQYIRCDISQYRQLSEIFKEHSFDYVYHLAAEFGRWNGEKYYEQMWTTNVIGTKHLIRLQEEHGFKMIFTSSSEVYGDYEQLMSEQIMDETEIRQINDYAISKWVNEMQILNSQAMHQTQTVRVRLFNVYGPGEYYSPYRSVAALFIYRAIHHMPYTVYLNHTRSSLYIDDCSAVLANIITRFRAGEVYNIAGNEPHDIKTLSDLILEYLHQNDRLISYRESEPFTTRDKIADISKAERDLGFNPKVSLREGIGATVEWMKKVYGNE